MKKKLISFISLFLLLFITFLSIRLIIARPINTNYNYSYQDEYNITYSLYQKYKPEIITNNTQDYTNIIKKELNATKYIYFKTNLRYNELGLTILPFCIILINNKLEYYSYHYITTLVHEIMHCNLFSLQEDYIQFHTFKYLYENENELLHQIGIEFGIRNLTSYEQGIKYNCRSQIINYFKNIG